MDTKGKEYNCFECYRFDAALEKRMSVRIIFQFLQQG